MGIQSETEIRMATPVLQVVTRLASGAGKVRDLILPQSIPLQKRNCALVEIRGQLFARHRAGVIAEAARQQFAAEAGILINFQHVDAGVFYSGGDQDIERLLPSGRGLMGHAGDQIDAQIVQPSRADPFEVFEHHCARMKPSRGRRLTVDQRLHAKAEAVDAQGEHGGERGVIQLARSALECDLSLGCDCELLAQGMGELLYQGRGEHTGGSSSQVNAVNLLGNEGFAEALAYAADFAVDAGDILFMRAGR